MSSECPRPIAAVTALRRAPAISAGHSGHHGSKPYCHRYDYEWIDNVSRLGTETGAIKKACRALVYCHQCDFTKQDNVSKLKMKVETIKRACTALVYCHR